MSVTKKQQEVLNVLKRGGTLCMQYVGESLRVRYWLEQNGEKIPITERTGDSIAFNLLESELTCTYVFRLEEADHVLAVNSHAELVEALAALRDYINYPSDSSQEEANIIIDQSLAKAKG